MIPKSGNRLRGENSPLDCFLIPLRSESIKFGGLTQLITVN
ncbi:hypothetical protein CES86_2443 [Brucella lupini]|uniref:Uncharacterized protein n=1 Tax=Brucella lupini TaxID=255457 RepID=A0A256GSA9_9HYPH|nr:hypothetical protein CES86_2443 [Brucella lupini]SUA59937.1 Uncharacterised protein [Brucella anthropi]